MENTIQIGNRKYKVEDVWAILDVRQAPYEIVEEDLEEEMEE